jgi:hypothetical protein
MGSAHPLFFGFKPNKSDQKGRLGEMTFQRESVGDQEWFDE